jgi:hypothetical protein
MSDLQTVNISDLLEKKGNLSYLSWAHAWGEALKIDPAATFEVHSFDRGDGVKQAYMDVNGTALVWVTVTMNGKPMTCQLPVMNARNEPITFEGRTYKDKNGREHLERIDSFNVNTAVMRCMVKAIALHGLGLYVYKGEDLPDEDAKEDKPAPKPAPKVEPKPQQRDWTVKANEGPEWVSDVCVATAKLLDETMSKADVMQIFQVNRAQFDKLKTASKSDYDDLMSVFKKMKEKFA